jgi:predicted nucleotidyltransferase
MKPSHGLTEKTIAQIAGALAGFREVERAILFGSRAKATHKRGSDIDLALVGGAFDERAVGKIYDALDDLLLPYRFSLIIFDGKTDPELAAHIKRVGIPFYEREATSGKLLRK